MSMTETRYPWRYALFLMAYYVTNSVYQGFITVYYKGEGLSTAEIGLLSAAVPIVSVLTQPFWGSLGDRVKSRNQLIRFLAWGAFLMILAFRVSSNPWVLLPIVCAFAAFYTAIQPMGDSVILEALTPERIPFGPMRLAGGLSFAVGSVVMGRLVQGQLHRVIYLTAGLLLFVSASTYALPETRGHQKKHEKASMRAILRLPHMAPLLIMVTLLQITMGYFYTFFSVHFVSLEGGNEALLGWCYLISACCETPFLLMSDRLFEKIGVGKLLCIAAATISIRWVILGTCTNVPIVMISQVFHGWGFIVMTVAMAKYIAATVPENLRARGQMLLSICGFGIARVVGNFGGGLLANAKGYQEGFLWCAAISIATLCIFAPKYLRMQPLNGMEAPSVSRP